ncbi:bacteriocin maturation protein [Alicyclobacillus cycloheptanicus]|uniref:Thiazole-containing bacteriocin maturation protein n=1 Tax=Alicyclobacillus cycloheptanicus TaxID=1457 RepID=A0ABT9XJ83_9BACL|nr:bacteriocin maturation protein [Alicyclobacillus cycloheptanicus]MDQ0190356.1 putative thiazole-containing bacteriocin maturation protein [Alicyclobacillus cycloheptanicus]WDM00007.1 bacteriocin maturation protein [Alicyclobacillus cycloheptanicus]
MASVQPWMRLKVKADTFFLPDADGAVYFRNNVGSFRMEGAAVLSWLEKLLPAFDGRQTLERLTEGLPAPYRDRIYQIADILYDNGFVRDVSGDAPHQLSDSVLQHFAPQIEFIDNLVGSGAHRFQKYRHARILTVGSGPILLSLAAGLLESGVKSLHLVQTAPGSVDITPLRHLAASYGPLDDLGSVSDWSVQAADRDGLHALLATMDMVLFVSESGDMDELNRIEAACNNVRRSWMTAVVREGVGIIVPSVREPGVSDPPPSFQAVLRRIHQTVFDSRLKNAELDAASGAVLANVLVFELFKTLTGVETKAQSRVYTLNVETLEGKWHDVVPPVAQGWDGHTQYIERIEHIEHPLAQLEADAPRAEMADVLAFFTRLTHGTTGLFHIWDEGNLPQLPLAQCRVQPIDPLSTGPAELLPETRSTGWTHDEARYEAGLTGIERYVKRRAASCTGQPVLGVGAGRTQTEAIGRGLVDWLDSAFRLERRRPAAIRAVQLGQIRDERCRFFLQALRAASCDPVLGLSEFMGCPVVWVSVKPSSAAQAGLPRFYGTVGLSLPMAIQRALHSALWRESGSLQNAILGDEGDPSLQALLTQDAATTRIDVEPWEGFDRAEVGAAWENITRAGQRLTVFDLASEPFLREVFAAVVGVSVDPRGV